MGVFFIGAVCGCILTLLYQKVRPWLSQRLLPAQYLKTHSVRRRNASELFSKDDSGQ